MKRPAHEMKGGRCLPWSFFRARLRRARPPLLLPLCSAVASLTLYSAILDALDPGRLMTQYRMTRWERESGLPSNSIQEILQTRDGYIWLATHDGLARFDGARFTTFDHRNTPELMCDFVVALHEDRDGALWIGTDGGGITRLKDGRFQTYSTQNGLASNYILSLCEDAQGALWIGTDGGGVSRLADGRFTNYTSKDGLCSDVVYALLGDRTGNVWIGTRTGLNLYSGGKLRAYTTRDGLSSNVVLSLHLDADGALWIGTYGGGLNRYENGRFTAYTTTDGLSADFVTDILRDKEGNLWLGTYGGGLNRFTAGHFGKLGRKQGLTADVVLGLCEDREGNLWVGTDGGGLWRIQDAKLVTWSTLEGLTSDVVRCVYQDSKGAIWLGTDDGLNLLSGAVVRRYTVAEGLPHDIVTAIHEDREGTLWLGTDGGGLSSFASGRFTRYEIKTGLSRYGVFAIQQGRDGSIWLGTRIGLYRFNNGSFSVFTRKEGLGDDFVLSIHEDTNGALWVGTYGGGLNQLRGGTFSVYDTSAGLPNDIVFAIHEDSEGILWIGTRGGLARLRNGALTSYTTRQGLPDDVVHQILEDGAGNLWMSSNRGIFRVRKSELNAIAEGKTSVVRCTSYDTSDGMPSTECLGGSQPAGCRSMDGRLWFCTTKGAVVIDPNHLKVNTTRPPVIIESIALQGKEVTGSLPAVLPAGSSNLEFHYTALSFIAPEKVRFKYMLEGLDDGWVDAGGRRIAYYTNIPPGSYRFRVMACNNDELWNEDGASHDFRIKPRFHQTYWFYAICGLTALLAAQSLHWYRVRTLKARERELTARVNDAMARIKVLSGLLPICAWCRRIRDENGRWHQVEVYIRDHSEAKFTHGCCEECAKKLLADLSE